MMTFESYETAVTAYLAQFQALREVPASSEAMVTRGASDIPATDLIDHADKIAEISAAMLPLSSDYLSSPEAAIREGISNQMLAQAATELQMATELLQIAEDDGQETAVTRSSSGVNLNESIADLEEVMSVPLGATPAMTTRSGDVPQTIDAAKANLTQTVTVSLDAILMRVQELSGDIAFDLIMQSEWAAVIEGAGLLREDIGDLLDKLKEGASTLFNRALSVARLNLLNVYDKILALLGKDAEDQARQKVKGWLNDVAETKEIELLEVLLNKLYQMDDFKKELPTWLAQSEADLETINKTAVEVAALMDKFIVLEKRLQTLKLGLVLAKLIKVPQVLLAIAILQFSLLTAVVYSGSDYIGYRELRFPNLTTGVGELVRAGLKVEAVE